MNEVFNRYIGKDCVIYLSNMASGVLEGKLIGITENWLSVECRDGTETVNIDYIIKIKEHPVNKKGKKKSVIY